MLASIRNENTDVSNKQQLSINVYGVSKSSRKLLSSFFTPAITNYTTVSARNVFTRSKLLESKI